jgi:hypothetical protein
MIDYGMRPQDHILYEKGLVIWFGDGIEWVNWLWNPPYPENSTEFLAIFIFFATFRAKNEFFIMQQVYVLILYSM